jgi:hypothetical protein
LALPFATQQIIRVVTDKVLEQVMKQMSQRQGATAVADLPAALPSGSPDQTGSMANLMPILERFNAAILELQNELEDRNQRLVRLEKRLGRFEKRWGWTAIVKITAAVFAACLFGVAFGELLRLGGWIH